MNSDVVLNKYGMVEGQASRGEGLGECLYRTLTLLVANLCYAQKFPGIEISGYHTFAYPLQSNF